MKSTYYKESNLNCYKLSIITILMVIQTIVYGQNGMIWQKCFGGPQSNGFTNMCRTDDGGYFLVGGYASSGGDFGSNYGVMDVGLIKIDSNGNKLWSNHFGGAYGEGPITINKGAEDKYYIIGNTQSYGLPNYHGPATPPRKSDGYVICINSSGNMIWQRCYGGFGDDYLGPGIVMDGYLYAAGRTIKSNGGDTGGNFDPDTVIGSNDLFICKINTLNGNLVHSVRLGGTNNDYVSKIILTNDHKLLILGYTKSDNINVPLNYGDFDAWALKIDTNFTVITSNIWGGSSTDVFNDAITTIDGGFVIYGTTQNTDTLTGNLTLMPNPDTMQLMLIKTDSNFNTLWQKAYGCDITPSSYATYGANNFIMTTDGYIMAAMSAPALCNSYPFSIGHSVFIKTDFTGNQLWVRQYGTSASGGEFDIIKSIIQSNDGSIVVGAVGHADANNSCTNPGVNPLNFWNIYKWNNNLIVGEEDKKTNTKEIKLYPNPTTQTLYVEGAANYTVAEVYDISCKFLLSTPLRNNQLDISPLAPGLYFIKLSKEDGSMVRKFIKE